MDIDTYLKRLWALWLALPTTALNYWFSWNHLPARIAMHYDVSGRPTNWATPTEARAFSLWFLVFVLVVVTGTGYLVAYMRSDRTKPAIVFLYLAIGLVCAFLNGFVWFNLAG